MPTTLAPDNLILGSHAFFARDGASITLPSPGTSGPGVVPGDTDTAWVEIGTLKNTKPSPARGEPQEVWAPAPGGLRLKKLIRPKRDLKISITSQDVSPLVIELLFGAGALTDSSTTFVPLAKGGALTGWLRLEWYDQSDSKRLSTHLYVELVVADDIDFDPEKVVEVRFETRALLASAAYTGTIAAAPLIAMGVSITATLSLVAIGVFAMFDQSPLFTGLSTFGIAGLQVWTLMQLQPVRDQVGQLKTDIAVLRQRLDDCQRGDCPFVKRNKETDA